MGCRPRLSTLFAVLTVGPLACHTTTRSSPDGGAGSTVARSRWGPTPPPSPSQSDGGTLYVVNADSDSVSIVDVPARSLVKEIPPGFSGAGRGRGRRHLHPGGPARALALSPDGATLYVTGERSGQLHVIDVASTQVTGTVALGSEPVGLVVSPDGSRSTRPAPRTPRWSRWTPGRCR